MAQYTYALIDGVMRQTAIRELYSRKEALQTIPLYINTRYKDNYDLGPILVATLDGSTLINEIQQTWADSATIIQSSAYLQVIADHLRQLITATDDTGSQSLFRFADPLVTWYWLNSYQENALVDILGPIDKWLVAKPIPDWQQSITEWQTFSNPQTEQLNFQINYLNEPQVQALEKAAEFDFKNKMYQWLQKEKPTTLQNKTPSEIGSWLDICFTNAKNFKLISERSIAIWISLSADYGVDFATIPDGIYVNWFTKNSQYKGLPSEVNIQNFYNDLVKQQIIPVDA